MTGAARMTAEPANETARIVSSIKRIMKSRAMTYAQLARDIGLSEPSVKRILSRATLTVNRLEQICRALDGLPLAIELSAAL